MKCIILCAGYLDRIFIANNINEFQDKVCTEINDLKDKFVKQIVNIGGKNGGTNNIRFNKKI